MPSTTCSRIRTPRRGSQPLTPENPPALACHQVSAQSKELFHGDVGPSLDGAGSRWKPEELRAIVTDSKQVFGPETVMPGFYSLNVGMDVRKDLVGKTILTAQQVEDVVAYLETLKE